MSEQAINGETTDGYHTFNELYEHRHALFILLATTRDFAGKSWMSIRHNDGSKMQGWFIAGIHLPSGDVSYHLPMRLWGECKDAGVMILPNAPKWDGHTSSEVVFRLLKSATNR